jgi:TonB family protein
VRALRTAALALLTSLAIPAQAVDRIEPAAASQFVGQIKKVCGAVSGARRPDPSDKGPTLFDLGGAHPAQALTLVITSKTRKAFVGPVEDRATKFAVCATGKIEKTADGLTLRIDDPQFLTGVELRSMEPFYADLPRPAQGSHESLVGPSVIKGTAINPKYTDAARKAKIEGVVEIEAVIREDGTVGDTRIMRSLDALYGLDVEAVKAFKQWKFQPATRAGRPAPVVVVGVLHFDVFERGGRP